jgi:prophage maintenance system killer protein
VTESVEFLTVEDVELLHDEQLRLFGGLQGLRDRAALESAVSVPMATFSGEFLHDDLFAMAPAYAFHLAQSQAFSTATNELHSTLRSSFSDSMDGMSTILTGYSSMP